MACIVRVTAPSLSIWSRPSPTPPNTPATPPYSSAIYGGVAGGLTDEADEFIRSVMGDMMDTQRSLPRA